MRERAVAAILLFSLAALPVREPAATALNDGILRTVVLGDSVARGAGGERARGIAGWLDDELRARRWPAASVLNLGIDGARTRNVRNLLRRSIGGNDLSGDSAERSAASQPCEPARVQPGTIITVPPCGVQSGLPQQTFTFECPRRGQSRSRELAIDVRSAFVDAEGLWGEIVVDNLSRRTIRLPRKNGMETYWIADVEGYPRAPEPSCVSEAAAMAFDEDDVLEVPPQETASLGMQLLVPSWQLWCTPEEARDLAFRVRYRPPQPLTVEATAVNPKETEQLRHRLERATSGRCRLHGHALETPEVVAPASLPAAPPASSRQDAGVAAGLKPALREAGARRPPGRSFDSRAARADDELAGDLDAPSAGVAGLDPAAVPPDGPVGLGALGVGGGPGLGHEPVGGGVRGDDVLTDLASVHLASRESASALAEGAAVRD